MPFWCYNMFSVYIIFFWINWKRIGWSQVQVMWPLSRKHGKMCGSSRHNRMQDTLPQPLFAAAGPDFSFEPVIITNGSSFTSHLPHARVHTHTHTSHSSRYPEWPPRSAVIMTLHRREQETGWLWEPVEGRRAGCVSRSVGESIRRLHTHTWTHTHLWSWGKDAAWMLGMPLAS